MGENETKDSLGCTGPFVEAMGELQSAGIPYVVDGAYGMHHYTGVLRDTKDLDLFFLPGNVPAAAACLANAGFNTWTEADHWLVKAVKDQCSVDLIYGFGNWISGIDEDWFRRSRTGIILGLSVPVAPIEDLIWIKSYVAHRERYDGADVFHLLHASQGRLNWRHLLRRFGAHWELLLSQLVLFRFVYPADQQLIPVWVMRELTARLERDGARLPAARICRGPLLDRYQYLEDIENGGFHDPREELAISHGRRRADVVSDREKARRLMRLGQVRWREVA